MIKISKLTELATMVYHKAPKKKHLRKMEMNTPNFLDVIIPRQFPPSNESRSTYKELKMLQSVDRDDDYVKKFDNVDKVYVELLEEFGVYTKKLEKLINTALKESTKFILREKFKHNRPRPHQLAEFYGIDLNGTELDSMKTPSFPSGHAAQAYLIAELLKLRVPHMGAALDDLAENIAYSRIVAKAHYPSDKAYGKKFGKKLSMFFRENLNEEFGAPTGVLPSPSRKMVKKMKKKGHTSVPYGSGYKKFKEAFAVRGNKIEKFITGKNLTHKGKKYKEIEFETIKVDNPKKMVTLRILAPKNLFGQEVPVRFQTLRRGPFLKTDTSKGIKESIDLPRGMELGKVFTGHGFAFEAVDKVKKVVAIYPGRFQPFGPHHKRVYLALKKKFGDAYIVTSNIKSPPRHPMNFAEKKAHMVKMGIPANRIVMDNPYNPAKLTKTFPKDTAVVFAVGAKDKGRLSAGKYFLDYNKNKNNLVGYQDNGYVIQAPHVSVKVAGKEVSGTVMRQVLGSDKIKPEQRKKLFKQLFGYYDERLYKMMIGSF